MPRCPMKKLPLLLVCLFLLSACAHRSQNNYSHTEVGQSSAVSFGTIIGVREIDITGENTGLGAIGGAAAGAGIGSQIGKGSGNVAAVAGIAVAGAVAGALIEQAASDRKGVEYTVTLQSGMTLTVIQEAPSDERILSIGERVIVQNTGGFQRVLSAETLPTEVKRPKGVTVVD